MQVDDIIQCKGAKYTRWRVTEVNKDGTLKVERVSRGPRSSHDETRHIPRPEYYKVVGSRDATITE